MISSGLAGIILAAGTSSRMGSDKALLPLPNCSSQTFLSANIDSLRAITELVIVVAGTNLESLKQIAYSRGVSIVQNPAPELGQFSSLQVGLQEVLSRGRHAALITHVDRLPASSATLEMLIKQLVGTTSGARKWAVVPEFGGEHGHPIAVGREMIEVMLKAPQNSNAREIEHAHRAHIQYLPVDDPAVLANVNSPEDYERMLKR